MCVSLSRFHLKIYEFLPRFMFVPNTQFWQIRSAQILLKKLLIRPLVGRSLTVMTNLVTLTMSCTWTGRASKAFAKWNIFWNTIHVFPCQLPDYFQDSRLKPSISKYSVSPRATNRKKRQVIISFYWNQLKEKSCTAALHSGQHCTQVLFFVQHSKKISSTFQECQKL